MPDLNVEFLSSVLTRSTLWRENQITLWSIEQAFFISEPMRRRFLINGSLFCLLGVVSVVDAYVRKGIYIYHPWRSFDFFNDRRTALELYGGIICLFLGLWLFSLNSKDG